MAGRGARIAGWLNNLAFGAVAVVLVIIVLLRVYPPLQAGDYLGGVGLLLAALAPVLALAGVVTGLASGIGWPIKAAIALILGIVVSFWPLFVWLLTSNCPRGAC